MKLTFWFNLLGWPEIIRRDGGPQFCSEFDDFCKNFYIHHELSSPYHLESNGLAEAAVKNAKSLLKKCEITGQNFQRCLSNFRNMPRSDSPSPASLLFTLPQKTDILFPPWPIAFINKNAALSSCAQRILHQTTTINKTAFSYSRLPLGSRVFVQNAFSKNWDQQAVVKATRDNGESYLVQLDNGKECICGRILLCPVKSTIATAHIIHCLPRLPLCAVPPDFKAGYKISSSFEILSQFIFPDPDTSHIKRD